MQRDAAELGLLVECFLIPFLGIWLPLVVFTLKLHWHDAPAALKKWAEESDHRISHANVRRFFKGPFSLTSSGSQVVYRVTVQAPKSQTRMAWVRIGSFWWPRSDRIEVVWDEVKLEPIDPASQPTQGSPLMWDRDVDTLSD